MLKPLFLKIFFGFLCLCVLGSNFWTMRKWTERTGVYDDICYLRQAHLFQRFGLGGFDTNITRDDDRYFETLSREIGYQAWSDPAHAPCHTQIGEKLVLQYPPGTGLALSIFPAGFQRVPLYGAANLIISIAALFAIWSAPSRRWIIISGIVGAVSLYFMINPAKASSSIPPTMIVCVMVGFLTTILANSPKPSRRIILAALIGLILGFAVSFRLANLFLSAGYFLVLFVVAARSRTSGNILQLLSFGAAYLLGLVPTLVANAINAGSILATTYDSFDARPPDFSFSVAREYLADIQGTLIILTTAWSIWAFWSSARKTAAAIVVINIAINLMFFLTHPIFTPYYLMPLAMLSIWTLLFSLLNDSSEADLLPGQAALVKDAELRSS